LGEAEIADCRMLNAEWAERGAFGLVFSNQQSELSIQHFQ
jgi:hypothetical protein